MEKQSFETDRIQELKNERINLQKKTFTKWMNTFLQENMKVDNIFEDLSDGKVLIRLLESISGEKVGRVARGKQRIHKLENVSKALMFLQKSVKLESIGPEDVVDGKQDLILGLLWMIILRFQISKVENESGSQDARSAKEALLLWCQRKTKGYPGVEIKNFTTSWRNGLAFNALIHKHRPDLLDFSKLQPQQHTVNLGLAFDTAEQRLGIAKLLDPEDLDIPRPDEKSVMTYVSMLYQYFAKMKHEETGGKRIAKILDVMIEIDKMKQKYTEMVEKLLQWIANKKRDLDSSVPKTTNLLQKSMNELKTLRTSDKPPKYIERADIEELFFVIQTKINANRLRPYLPPAGKTLSDINAAWQELEKAEHRREIRLREELARQERLSQLAERFEKKVKLRESWLDDMLHVLESEETSKSLQIADVNVSLKRLEAIETDVKAREVKINTVTAISKELHAEMYETYEKVRLRQEIIENKWQNLLTGLEKRRNLLVGLNEVTPVIADIEQVSSQLKIFEVNLSIEDQKKELIAVNDYIHKHSLLESQLNAYQRQIRSVVLSAKELLKKRHPHSILVKEKLHDMTRSFEEITKASNEKRKRLEDSRDFQSFKDTMKKELGFIQEKAQLAGSKEVGKDLLSLTRLQTKLQGLEAEVEACQARCDVTCQTGNQLISAKNASSQIIKSTITDLQNNLQNLRLLMKDRAERLAEASQSFQYYSDANDVESWIGEQMQLVMSEYYGKDSETAKSLLQRHEQITEEIIAFKEDMLMLQDECKQIEATDNKADANQKESSPRAKRKEYDEVEVETETEDEEIVEKEVDKKVIKEFKVPQVIARHSYEGEGLPMKKGEIFYLAAKTNKDWWSVRRVSSKESGYVPAAYVKEIDPKIFKKPVIEKVTVQETVKIKRKKIKKVQIERKERGNLVDKRAKRTSSILRKTNKKRQRKPRFTQHFDRENVTTRHLAIVVAYAKLKKIAEERGENLKNALAYFEFCSAHDEVTTWINDQVRYLTRLTKFGGNIDVETIKRLLERVENEISANEKSYLQVQEKGNEILQNENSSYKEDVRKRLGLMIRRYEELQNLKKSKQEDLIRSHGIEMFLNSCAEAKSWISGKMSHLSDSPVGNNQETIRALQRKHQNFEHELAAIEEKLQELQNDSNGLRQMHPTTCADVDVKENEVLKAWETLQEKAAKRKTVLQEAYGQQGFLADYRDLVTWAKDAKNRFSTGDLPRDMTLAEELIIEHDGVLVETKGNLQRLDDVIKCGEALNLKSKQSTDLKPFLRELESYQKEVPELWQQRQFQLSSCKNALVFYRDADSFISKEDVIQKLLTTEDTGATMDNVTTLIKQVDEISQRISQQKDKLNKLVKSADDMINKEHYDSPGVMSRREEIIRSHDKTNALFTAREEALRQSQSFQQFRGDIEEFLSWIDDKVALVNDESYMDLSNLQTKVLKNQALQAEVISNQVTKNRIEQVGEEMIAEEQSSVEEVRDLLDILDDKWELLENNVKDKQERLEQATRARAFSNATDDLEIWCDQTENLLSSNDFGDDLSSVKFLRNKHQLLEKEIQQHKDDLQELENDAIKMCQDGNFKSTSIMEKLDRIKNRMTKIAEIATSRSTSLENSYSLQQFLFEVHIQMSWINEHLAQIKIAEFGTNVTTAQRLLNRHEAMENELRNHSTIIENLIKDGDIVVNYRNSSEMKTKACEQLRNALRSLRDASGVRKKTLQQELEAFQFLLDANDIGSWLDEKATLVSGLQQGRNLDTTERQLKKINAFIEDMKHVRKNIELVKERAKTLKEEKNPKEREISQKVQSIVSKEEALSKHLTLTNKKAKSLHHVYQFFHDAENLRDWISGKLKTATAEGYGKDYEHWQILTQKFEDFRVGVIAGKNNFAAVMKLADDIISENGPHASSVSNAKNKLSSMWQKLMEKVKLKNSRFKKTGELHKFNMQVSDILSNLKEKESKMAVDDLGDDVVSTESKVRSHDTTFLEIEAVGKQIEAIERTAQKLKQNYPGKTAEQIQNHETYVKKVWTDLLRKANIIRDKLHGSVDYHRLHSEISKLQSWCKETIKIMKTNESYETVDEVEEAMDKMDDLKLEIDGKEEKFAYAVGAGEQMVEEGHHATEEIQEKLEELLTSREDLHNLWLQRKQHLSELYDYLMFCRESTRINGAIDSYKTILSSVSGVNSAEEIESMLKRIKKLRNMLETQNVKTDAALELGKQLIKDQHYASAKVEDLIIGMVQNGDAFRDEIAKREMFLKEASRFSSFSLENEELMSWILEKLETNRSKQIDAANLKMYTMMHKSDLVELKARDDAKLELRKNGEKMIAEKHHASKEIKELLSETFKLFEELKSSFKKIGQELESTRDLVALKRDIDFAETYIMERERLLATDDIGEDFDKCRILRKKVENTITEMRADNERMHNINSKAKPTLANKSDLSDEISMHLRMLNSRWENVQELSSSRKIVLGKASKFHEFKKDAAEIQSRMNEKIILLQNASVAEDLNGVQKQIRKHALLESDIEALEKTLEKLDADAHIVAKESVDDLTEIQNIQTKVIDVWETLMDLIEERQSVLQAAEHLYRFQTDVSSLSSWMKKVLDKLTSTAEPRNLKETKTLLKFHQEIKSEMKVREEVFERVKKYGGVLITEGGLPADEVEPKLVQLEQEKAQLEKLWQRKHVSLNQSHDLQRFGSEIKQIENWLKRKKDDLNSVNYGDSLEETERMLAQQENVMNTVDKFQQNLNDLSSSADSLTAKDSPENELMQRKYEDLKNGIQEAKELAARRYERLQESMLYFKFRNQTEEMIAWFEDKMRYAGDLDSIKKALDLESIAKGFDAFTTEIQTNRRKMEEISTKGQELISRNIRPQNVQEYIDKLLDMWQKLMQATSLKEKFLSEKLTLEKFEKSLRGFNQWMDKTERALRSDNFGKDLDGTILLQSIHKELVDEISGKEKSITALEDMIDNNVKENKDLSEMMRGQCDDICERFRELVLLSKMKERALEHSLEFHSFCQEIEEIRSWMKTKIPHLNSGEFGSDLTGAKHIFKKHQMLETEISSHEAIVQKLLQKLGQVLDESYFKEEIVVSGNTLKLEWQSLKEMSAARSRKIRESVFFHKFTTDVNQALLWLRDQLPLLESKDFGKDVSASNTLIRNNAVLQNDLSAFEANIEQLKSRMLVIVNNEDGISKHKETAQKLQESLTDEYKTALELCALRNNFLLEKVQFLLFNQQADAISAWIEEKIPIAKSEDYGMNLQQAEEMLNSFIDFVTELKSYEVKLVSMEEFAKKEEENTNSEISHIKLKSNEVVNAFVSLKEASMHRLECLENAKSVHGFEQMLGDAKQWMKQKEQKLISIDVNSNLESLEDLRRRHDAFLLDLDALQSKATLLHNSAVDLCQKVPSFNDKVDRSMKSFEHDLQELTNRADSASVQLTKAEELKSFRQASEDMREWIKDRIAVIDSNIQCLLSKTLDHENAYIQYKDHLTERDARKTRFESLNKDGLRIINNMVEAKLIVETKIADLQEDWTNLDLALKRFHGDLEHTKDSESLKDDLVNLDKWIDLNSEGLDEIDGSSLDEIEEMLRRQDDFEKSIAVQEGRFQSTLGRLSKYAENVQSKFEKRGAEKINPEEKIKDPAYRNDGDKNGSESYGAIVERPPMTLEDPGRQTLAAGNKLKDVTSVNEGNKLDHLRMDSDKFDLKNNTDSLESAGKHKEDVTRKGSNKRRAEVPTEEALGSMKIEGMEQAGIERDFKPATAIKDHPDHLALQGTQSLVKSNDYAKSNPSKQVEKPGGQQSSKETEDALNSMPFRSIKMGGGPQEAVTDEQQFTIPEKQERVKGNLQISSPGIVDDMSISVKITDTERAPSSVNDDIEEEDVSQPNFEDDIWQHDQDVEEISYLNAYKGAALDQQPFDDSISNTAIDIPDLSSTVPGTKNEFMEPINEPEFIEPVEEPILIPETHDTAVESMPDMDEMFGYPELNEENFPASEVSADFEFFDSEDDDEIEFNFDVPKGNAITTRDPFESRSSVEEFDRRLSLPREDERPKDVDISGDNFELFIEDSEDAKTSGEFEGEIEDDGGVESENLSGIQIQISDEDLNGVLTNDDLNTQEYLDHGANKHEIKNPSSDTRKEVTYQLREDSATFEDSLTSGKTWKDSSKIGSKDIFSSTEGDRNINMPEIIVSEQSSCRHDEQSRENPIQCTPREYGVMTSDIGDLPKNSQPQIVVSQPIEFEDDTIELKGSFVRDENESKVSLKFSGDLKIREEFSVRGKRFPNRKWKLFYSVIIESLLVCYQSEDYFKRKRIPEKELNLDGAMIHVEPANNNMRDMLRLRLSDRSEYLVMSEDVGIVDDFLMAVTDCTGMMGQEDSVSLPPAPPPPSLPKDVAMKTEIRPNSLEGSPGEFRAAGKSSMMGASDRNVPDPELSSDESDEFADVLPPEPIRSLSKKPDLVPRRQSMGLLDLVGRSANLTDNMSFSLSSDDDDDDDDDDRESKSSSGLFDPESLNKRHDPPDEEAPPKKSNNMNMWFSRTEESFADETTPITPFDQDADTGEYSYEVTTGDLSGFVGKETSTHPSTSKGSSRPGQRTAEDRPRTLELPTSSGVDKGSKFVDRSPVSPGKEHKKKAGFLSGIFKKKK